MAGRRWICRRGPGRRDATQVSRPLPVPDRGAEPSLGATHPGDAAPARQHVRARRRFAHARTRWDTGSTRSKRAPAAARLTVGGCRLPSGR
jgi:hypothetical protein